MRVAYAYRMANEPGRVRMVAPRHAGYWRSLALPGYAGGPFADRSGGLIVFEIVSMEDAHRLVAADPFVRERLIESSWLKEWAAE